MSVALRSLAATAVLVCAAALPAWAGSKNVEPPPTSEGRLSTREGDRVVDVPLEHTEVKISVAGHLATVDVEQTFRNPYDEKIEAIYLFPLPTGAAVNALEIETGGRVVKGRLERRAEAKAIYVRAKAAGLVATLLTQERPNLFTQHVANLEPGAKVVVRMRYLEPLVYQGAGYELVFPMVAGPRHLPKTSKQAGEAAAVQPAVLPEGVRSSHDIGLTVELDAGVPVRALRSPSHRIDFAAGKVASLATVKLAAGDTIPNKDFVLRWEVAGEAPAVSVMAHRVARAGEGAKGAEGAEGAFFLTLQPPRDAVPDAITPREIVFVLDTSSSMRGAPWAKARELVAQILAGLRADDTFQIVRFADAASALGPAPLSSSAQNRAHALAWLDGIAPAGGTTMTAGVGAALDVPHDPARLRLVVFVTDGYVGNEDEILKTVHDRLGAARLYSFGVGTAVNRYLLEEMASFGRGTAQIVRPDEDTADVVKRFIARIDTPVLTDVSVDWGGLAVAELTPAAVPDVFVGQPVVIAGRYAKGGRANVVVKGMAAGRPVSFTVPVELPDERVQPAIATVWARAKITELGRVEIRAPSAATREGITALALEHGLMSRYTAFVAIDDSRVTGGGDAKTVQVPVEVPAGLRRQTVGSVAYGGIGMGMAAPSVGYGSGTGGGYAYSLRSDGDGGGGSGIGGGAAYGKIGVISKSAEPRPDLPPPPTKSKPVDPAPAAEAAGRYDAAQALKDQKGKLAGAYRRALKQAPGVSGKFVLRLAISAAGEVTAAEVIQRPDVAGADVVAAELIAEARKLRFPAAGEASTVTVPFVFQAE